MKMMPRAISCRLIAAKMRIGESYATAKSGRSVRRHPRRPERGLFTGNRGIIHDPETKTLLKKRWALPGLDHLRLRIPRLCGANRWAATGPGGKAGLDRAVLPRRGDGAGGRAPALLLLQAPRTGGVLSVPFGEAFGIAEPRAPKVDKRLHKERLAAEVGAKLAAGDCAAPARWRHGRRTAVKRMRSEAVGPCPGDWPATGRRTGIEALSGARGAAHTAEQRLRAAARLSPAMASFGRALTLGAARPLLAYARQLRMQRLFVSAPLGPNLTFDLAQSRATICMRVLRMREGAEAARLQRPRRRMAGAIVGAKKRKAVLATIMQTRPSRRRPTSSIASHRSSRGGSTIWCKRRSRWASAPAAGDHTAHAGRRSSSTGSGPMSSRRPSNAASSPFRRSQKRSSSTGCCGSWEHGRQLVFCDEDAETNNPLPAWQAVDGDGRPADRPEGGFSEDERQHAAGAALRHRDPARSAHPARRYCGGCCVCGDPGLRRRLVEGAPCDTAGWLFR